jgi:hypothetical protein
MTQLQVWHGSFQRAVWLSYRVRLNQYRVRGDSVKGYNMAQLRMGHGFVKVRPGSVRVRRG